MIFFRVAQLHTPTQIITSNLCYAIQQVSEMWKHIHNVMGRNDEERRKETNGWRSLEAGSVCSIFQSPIIWGLGKGHRTSRLPTSTAPPKNLQKPFKSLPKKLQNQFIISVAENIVGYIFLYDSLYSVGIATKNLTQNCTNKIFINLVVDFVHIAICYYA